MIRSAKESGWVLIEQRVDPDPLDVVADELFRVASCQNSEEIINDFEDCDVSSGMGGISSVRELVRAELVDIVDSETEEIEI